MKDQIGVQIEGQRYVRLLLTDAFSRGKLRLTTVKDNQSRAKIKIFFSRESKKHLLREVELDNIPPAKAGVPDIHVFGEFDGKNTLSVRIELNGEPRIQIRINIPQLSRERSRALVYVPVAVVVLGLAIVLIWKAGVFKSGEPLLLKKRAAEKLIQAQKVEQVRKDERDVQKKEVVQETREQKEVLDKPIVDKESQEVAVTTKVEKKEEIVEATKEPTPQKVVFEPQIVYFLPNSARLTPETQEALKAILPLLNKNKNDKFILSGHCALYGTEQGRQKLSVLRASNVYAYLKNLGWSPMKEPEVIGFGGTQYVTKDKKNQHLNRRVEIIAEKQ